ncbi:MAG: hypothetical protein COZ34_04280 [Candidatus Pacebacteria bacterium CG_4_10_14_3_um_filter_34_15]|nr:hypothetical protein [Candidatus Pacearchaeota archaeon]NCQ65734.1 hypothetical protein [Candidatus Paceibacterota bacterium]OIO44444.1 MAG: hypothetical protein AUJ41_02910 [Candidatus Pacebacteria bacterium CG1_02_43_31]PIQ81420.1 MAG: hypothetical protein COV78_00350 [Candidatus Pacebacteria bacterium CG11_big_fil_rev_8_21_14_0_20_34_55]PIX81259.1 MAG: hypothetical protein COZ34_04280 [Candidatus Pacebacteria bacterium CG_4_10_14_3_um_filter_34_15]PJC43750.1 MAG: hypothetical protein CO0
MKKISYIAFLILLVFTIGLNVFPSNIISAATLKNAEINTNVDFIDPDFLVSDATEGATATDSTKLASPSAEVVEKIQEKKDQDITETSGKQKTKLETYMDENPPESLSWNNFIQHAIRTAVSNGLQVNVIVLIILFPLIASLIAASRHIIGLRGFGIYIPAVLSVALVSTGVVEGLIIFLVIALTAIVARKILGKAKLSYLPRTSLMLWMVSLGIFIVLMLAPFIKIVTLLSVNIFPILILVLLAENFLDAQAKTKQSEALALTIETIGLAVFSGFLLKFEPLQKLALSEPELLLLAPGLINILIGKFAGLRVSERLRFRSLIEEE